MYKENMLNARTINEQPQTLPLAQRWQAWFRARRAAVLAAAWLWLLFAALAAVTLLTGWASRLLTLVLEIMLSFWAGVLAAWIHRRERPERPQYVRMGALAGIFLPATTALAMTLLAVVLALVSLGAVLPLMIPYYVFLPVEMGACSMLAALGALIFRLLFGR